MNRAFLEHVVKFDPDLKSLMAEAHVHSKKCFVPGVGAEPESDVALQLPKIESGFVHEYFSCVREQGHIQAAEYFPTVFRVHHYQVVAAEAIRAVAAKIVGAAEHRLHVERNRVPVVLVGEGGFRANREYPPLI